MVSWWEGPQTNQQEVALVSDMNQLTEAGKGELSKITNIGELRLRS